MGGEFGVCFLDFNDLTRDNIKEICSILEIQESFDADTKQDRDEEGDGDEIGDVTVPEWFRAACTLLLIHFFV